LSVSVVSFQDLPLADRKRRWNGSAANKRLRKWANATEKPNQRYRKGFLWYDAAGKDKFGSYKLQIADVIDGRLKAVPRGIFQAAVIIQGGRGAGRGRGRSGVVLPRKDIPRVKSHLARYYRKLGEEPPWER
jgi:hypothetical protein